MTVRSRGGTNTVPVGNRRGAGIGEEFIGKASGLGQRLHGGHLNSREVRALDSVELVLYHLVAPAKAIENLSTVNLDMIDSIGIKVAWHETAPYNDR